MARPLIFFDLETTGLDLQHDRIVELAAIKMMGSDLYTSKPNFTVVDTLEYRFNPGIPISEGAMRVHGITDEQVENKLSFKDRADELFAYFLGCDLAGYNIVSFDIPMLQAEFERCGLTLKIDHLNVVDAYKIFVTREPRDLKQAYKFYCNEDLINGHSALADAKATQEVLEAQIEKYGLACDTAALALASKGDSAVDLQGKLIRIDGDIKINFGKYKGTSLKALAKSNRGYIEWMLNKKIVYDAEYLLWEALDGK